MIKQTPLYAKHVAANAKMVDFSGWSMPLHYGSQLEEHHWVRSDAGVFDVSHMTIIDITGIDAGKFLRILLANNIDKLKRPGKALYSCMLNETGGVIDDLIVYWLNENRYRMVVNASTRQKDWDWLVKHSQNFVVELKLQANHFSILAIQGPKAVDKAKKAFTPTLCQKIQSLKSFEVVEEDGYCIARTGYTGEDGIEAMIPNQDANIIWDRLLAADIKPCGLGARDTLRLEAGFSLYGAEMDETKTPLESNLGWTVAWEPQDRRFIGRDALEAQKNNVQQKIVGLILEQKGVLRNHQKVIIPDIGEGEITSGSFSPILQQAIALARVPVTTGEQCFVNIRGQLAQARVVKPDFIRQLKKCQVENGYSHAVL